MLEGYEKPFDPNAKVTEVYIDADIVNDPETLAWVISEAKRCYGEDIHIEVYHGNGEKNGGETLSPPGASSK